MPQRHTVECEYGLFAELSLDLQPIGPAHHVATVTQPRGLASLMVVTITWVNRSALLDQAERTGAGDGVGAGANRELAVDGAHVRADSVR